MNKFIELRKQELTTQINQMIGGIEYVISTHLQYIRLKHEVETVETELDRIKQGFNPESDSPKSFEKCISELKELEREVKKIKSGGDAEKRRLRRNAASSKYAGTGASTLAIIGGITLGLGGCVSCVSTGIVPTIPRFNLITGLIIGVIGGAVIGALIGAFMGQTSERESGDSTSGVWLSIGGIAILVIFGILLMSTSQTDVRPMNSAPPVNNQTGNQSGQFVLISECNTPCRMEVGYGQRIETGNKVVLVKFNGKNGWLAIDGGSKPITNDQFNPGLAQFISPKNQPSIRVQILRQR